MSIKPVENSIDFIDETERKIIYEELPVLVKYLSDLEVLLMQSQDRQRVEIQSQEDCLAEIRRMTLHVVTRIHQLMNLPYIKQLIEEHEKLESEKDEQKEKARKMLKID